MFISRKWDEHKLLAMGYAYEQASLGTIRATDKPCCIPPTELRDLVRC